MGIVFKVLKKLGIVSKVLPAALRMWAQSDGWPGKVYWWLEGKKTVSGVILIGIGAALREVAPMYPELEWLPAVMQAVTWLGATMASVGLVDAGVRSPWPKGTKIPPTQKLG